MQNQKLRDYLFETIWEKKTRYWIVLRSYYNDSRMKQPDELVLLAHKELLSWIIETEGIRRDDVIHNASS